MSEVHLNQWDGAPIGPVDITVENNKIIGIDIVGYRVAIDVKLY